MRSSQLPSPRAISKFRLGRFQIGLGKGGAACDIANRFNDDPGGTQAGYYNGKNGRTNSEGKAKVTR
jgi:hypothetical protein